LEQKRSSKQYKINNNLRNQNTQKFKIKLNNKRNFNSIIIIYAIKKKINILIKTNSQDKKEKNKKNANKNIIKMFVITSSI